MISIQNVGKELFTYHLVGDGEFGLSFMHSADGQHSEVEKQTHKIIGIGYAFCRESGFQFSGDISLL